jgi:ABC-type antimicrobial peptide transport system permease subunit
MIAATTLSTAFVVYFLFSSLIAESYGKQAGVTVETYQVWLVVISFIVGMIGLMNSTLMAVFERYREIGTMKFLGALDRHILKLFVVESMIIGLVGGMFGFVGGSTAAATAVSAQVGASALLAIPVLEFLVDMGFSVGLATALSIVATIYPAYKAAKLRPVEALSYEL